MKITSEEIARLANVSRSTVSRVINNYPNVPEKTRQKVLEVIQEHGYVPNSSARALAGKTNNIIALFIADIDDKDSSEIKWRGTNSPYFLNLIGETINESKKHDYMVLVYIITDKSEYEQIEHTFINRTIHGGIFVGFRYDAPEINMLIDRGYNMVLVDQIKQVEKMKHIKSVNSKNKEGAYEATKYLINKGHRHIGHISGDKRLSSIDRQEGYLKAMKDYNLNIDPSYITVGLYREEVAYEATKKLLENKDITAIFVANDIMAIGAIKAINDMNMKVPEDISIVGFDNSEFQNNISIKLTTMEISIKEIATSAVKLLLDDNEEKTLVCEAKLIERESVKDMS